MTSSPHRQEILALHLSLLLTVLFACSAIAIALVSDSETMTLEAMSAAIDIVVSILAIFVARKVNAPADRRYHFGYTKYEPLMTTVEGVLLAGVCVGAIVYAVRDLLHPEPVEDASLVVIYSAASFSVSVLFGSWMRRTGRRAESPLATAEAELWIVEGWLALGVCMAFAASLALGRVGKLQATAYVDPSVCIALSLVFLRKPLAILRESVADLVDANPYANTANEIEDRARELAERHHLRGLESVRVRRAGRRVFAVVSFFDDPQESLEDIDVARRSVVEEMVARHPNIDIAVLFRPSPATPGPPGTPASA